MKRQGKLDKNIVYESVRWCCLPKLSRIVWACRNYTAWQSSRVFIVTQCRRVFRAHTVDTVIHRECNPGPVRFCHPWISGLSSLNAGIPGLITELKHTVTELTSHTSWIVVGLQRKQLMSKILINVADNGIVAAKKKCQFHSGNCMALTTDLFVLAK